MESLPNPSEVAETGPELPAHRSPGARDTGNVLDERPDLSGAEFAALEQAVELITTAEALEATFLESGVSAPGSAGQLVVNPGLSESHLARTAAATILNRLVGVKTGALTNSQHGRAAANARWRNRWESPPSGGSRPTSRAST